MCYFIRMRKSAQHVENKAGFARKAMREEKRSLFTFLKAKVSFKKLLLATT